MRHHVAALALVAAVSGAASCKNTRCEEAAGDPVDVDFSRVQPSGKYLFRTDAVAMTWTANRPDEARLTIHDDAGATEIVYAVERQGTRVQNERVVQARTTGGQQDGQTCVETAKYREERWTVPRLTLTAKGATRGGQPLALDDSVSLLRYMGSRFVALVAERHFIDRARNDAYVGFEVKSPASTTFNMHFTVNGQTFSNGL